MITVFNFIRKENINKKQLNGPVWRREETHVIVTGYTYCTEGRADCLRSNTPLILATHIVVGVVEVIAAVARVDVG